MTSALMVQGTGSDVGKSLIVAGLCRLFARQGLRVRPFKPQNMSNNAAVASEGEIGRAQALQARACGVAPSVHMNPVLLKPESETGAQVILRGKRLGSVRARDYAALKPRLLPAVLDSFARLEAEADLILVEGAGSPAEINLRAGDIANMGFAEATNLPVILVGDIERGGVIANLVGTHALLTPAERRRVRGFVINRFRGDVALFREGERIIAERTGWAALGTVPWCEAARRLPAEDSVDLAAKAESRGGPVRIAVPVLPRIANFDDLDPLRLDPAVSLRLVERGRPIPEADLVILPGSKSTISDLAALRDAGWDIDLKAHVRRGGHVLGLCGGFQMLGRRIADPDGLEGPPGAVEGLGLLAVETVLTPEKRVTEVTGRHVASAAPVRGYEIHLGRTDGPDRSRPFLQIDGAPEGAVSADGRVRGTYVHGLFASDAFRAAFLASLGARHAPPAGPGYEAMVDAALDEWAELLAASLDIAAIRRIAGRRQANRPSAAIPSA